MAGKELPSSLSRNAVSKEEVPDRHRRPLGDEKTPPASSGRRFVASFIKTENGPYLCCSLILAKHSLQ